MTDDLEPRLRAHLRQRASHVSVPSDVADVHHRVTEGHRRRTRALATTLAIALVAGPVAGWALARTTQADVDTLTATGGAAAAGDDDAGSGLLIEGVSPSYLDPEMELLSERTTAEGIRLVVRSTVLGPRPDGGPCVVDGLVRVGIEDGPLIDVALFETSPTGASFGIAGGADGRPMWVVLARGYDGVGATFPTGQRDVAEAAYGVAVLAAYAAPGQSADHLMDDVIEIEGSTAGPAPDDVREVVLNDGSGGCPNPDGVISTPPVEAAMPEPGEPPADEDAAIAEITDTFTKLFDGSGEPHPELRERPEVWADANERFKQEQPDYAAMAPHVHGEVDEIVFTAPDQASVRFRLIADDPSIPAPGERIGVAVLIDGVWKLSIDTSCELISLAGIECDYSLEE